MTRICLDWDVHVGEWIISSGIITNKVQLHKIKLPVTLEVHEVSESGSEYDQAVSPLRNANASIRLVKDFQTSIDDNFRWLEDLITSGFQSLNTRLDVTDARMESMSTDIQDVRTHVNVVDHEILRYSLGSMGFNRRRYRGQD